MSTFAITNPRTGATLAREAKLANNFWTRFKGLMGTEVLPQGQGLLIVPCNSVHCIGMKYAIDVLFLSKEGEVLHVVPVMRPGSVSPVIKKARATLELPAGIIQATGTKVGDKLELPPIP
ncbi:MAG: DUF192 domain-containing protein [Candidatus Sericytochromatia bacterium]